MDRISRIWAQLSFVIKKYKLEDLPGSPSYDNVYRHVYMQLERVGGAPELVQLKKDIDVENAYQYKHFYELR